MARQTNKTGSDTVKEGLDYAQDAAAGAKAKVGETAEAMRDNLNALADDTGEQGRRMVESLSRTVEERPLLAVLAAFGLGMVISRLIDRR